MGECFASEIVQWYGNEYELEVSKTTHFFLQCMAMAMASITKLPAIHPLTSHYNKRDVGTIRTL